VVTGGETPDRRWDGIFGFNREAGFFQFGSVSSAIITADGEMKTEKKNYRDGVPNLHYKYRERVRSDAQASGTIGDGDFDLSCLMGDASETE